MSLPTESETSLNQRISQERDLHELFRIWEQRYTTNGYDPEPIVRRYFTISLNFVLGFVLIGALFQIGGNS